MVGPWWSSPEWEWELWGGRRPPSAPFGFEVSSGSGELSRGPRCTGSLLPVV